MESMGWTVAVSYLEWIRWVATGWFRCADRVVWLNGIDDQVGVDSLLDRTADLQPADDQGQVIALLGPNFVGSAERIESARTSNHVFISIEAVEHFIPLSARGARLLEADAERASIRLGEPVLEPRWVDWRDRRLEEEAHRRGLSFCKALGLNPPDLVSVRKQILDILAGRVPPPNAAKSKQTFLEGTRAFGWAAALSVAKLDEGASAALESSPLQSEAVAIIKAFKADFDIRRPLLSDDNVVKLASELDEILRSYGGVDIPIAVIAAALHYKDLALAGRELVLPALLEDMVSLASNDPSHASLCAYAIGRSMESVAVTTLLYQSDHHRFRALAPAKPAQNLNVLRRAAEKYESTISQSIPDLPSTTTPDSPSLPPNDDTGLTTSGAESLQAGMSTPEESAGSTTPSESDAHTTSLNGAEVVQEAHGAPDSPSNEHSGSLSMSSEAGPAHTTVELPRPSVQEPASLDLFQGDPAISATVVQPERNDSRKKKPRGDSRPKS